MGDAEVAKALMALAREIEKLRLTIKGVARKEAEYQHEIISATEHGGWNATPDSEEMLP